MFAWQKQNVHATKFNIYDLNLHFSFAIGNQQMLRVHQTTSTVTVIIVTALQP